MATLSDEQMAELIIGIARSHSEMVRGLSEALQDHYLPQKVSSHVTPMPSRPLLRDVLSLATRLALASPESLEIEVRSALTQLRD